MRLLLAGVAGVLLLQGCDGRTSGQPRVSVEDVRIQLPAVRGRPGTAYFRLETNSRPMHLVGISSPQVRSIELHDSRMQGGIARMEKLENPAFERAEMAFEPGGRHAMLFGIDRSIKAGDSIPLTFTFDPAPAVTVEAKVTNAGEHDAEHTG